MKNQSLLALLVISGALMSCSSQTTDREAPRITSSAITIEGEQKAELPDPKVNILFVVDNSGSMKTYQEKMAKNIGLFAKHFLKNTRIDYRIGVVPVYDSKYLGDTTVYKSGVRKMNALGELVPLKGLPENSPTSKLYVTRDTPNAKSVLEQSVAIGVQWGPEAEESFSPVLAVMDSVTNQTKNENFYDPDAYLAVIFLTDADDVTPELSGEDFYERLVQLKGGDRSKILIAAALPNINKQSETCTTDGRGPLQSFPSLLSVSGAIMADLCSANFGERLASFGRYLVQRVGAQRIALNFTPDIDSLEVTYGLPGSKEEDRIQLPRGPQGYFFYPESNEIVISPDLELPRQEGAVILIKATPANLSNYNNGRLTEVQ